MSEEGRHSVFNLALMRRGQYRPTVDKLRSRKSPLSGDYLPRHAADADRDKFPSPFFGRYYNRG